MSVASGLNWALLSSNKEDLLLNILSIVAFCFVYTVVFSRLHMLGSFFSAQNLSYCA